MAHFELWERETLNQFAAEATRKLLENEAKIERLRAAIAPLAECHLPPAGYEHLGVTAHFKTEQIIAAKEAAPNARLEPPANTKRTEDYEP